VRSLWTGTLEPLKLDRRSGDARDGPPMSPLARWPIVAEAALVAGVTFGSASVLATTLLASALGALTPAVGALALLVGVAAAWLAVRSAAEVMTLPSWSPAWTGYQAASVLAFALVSVRQFGWISFERGGVLWTLLPYNYGDLPLHWTFVRHVASGAPFWPENPILTGERLRYPLGVDLLTSVLAQLGFAIETLLPLMGLAGAALAALALRGWGGAFAVAGFLFAGGLAGIPALVRLSLVDTEQAVAWKNLFLALFVPQRGFLLALPAGLVLLRSWRARLLRGEPGLPAWLEGLLWGALPLVHLHSFAALSGFCAAWALLGGRLRSALPSLAVALLPASWGVFVVTGGFRAAGLMGFAPGWMMAGESPLAFLLRNFGFWLALVAAALVVGVAARAGRREALALLLPPFALFAALFFVRLAPWAWDNTKVMIWCHLVMLPALYAVVLARLPTVARAIALALLFASGVQVQLWAAAGSLPRLEVFERAEYDAVCDALESVKTTRVATVQTFNHPVALCGRPIVAGYSGHLWSHGFAPAQVEQRLKQLLEGAPGWDEQARALGASHLFWGRREAATFPGSARPWERLAAPVASGSWGALYSLR
jgi:hypothetical protein